ncbi:URA9 [Sanghuangporus sanghuang]
MLSRLPSVRQAYRLPQIYRCRRRFSTAGDGLASSVTFGARRVVATTAVLVSGTLFAFYFFDARSAIHRYVFTPVLRYTLDPETSHKVAVKVLRSGLGPKDKGVDDERLRAELWGEALSNPIGLAAGFDKNGEAIDGLFDLGFSWVEIGSITPKPQPGNPKPRVFHLPEDSAMINRYGFPSEGAVSVLSRLRARLSSIFAAPEPQHASLRPNSLLAINLGKNKASPPDSPEDFLHGVRLFAPFADVLVVNVSSPNTPGLRGMQTRGLLEELLVVVASECDLQVQKSGAVGCRPRVVVKISPDLDDNQLVDIAEAVKATPGIDGVIVSNTTIQRPASLSPDSRKEEMGGLSGAPLKPLTLGVLRTLRAHLPASVPIIGCGGISSGEDALEYARAGASFVQLYTAFGYDGPGACRRIKDELKEALEKEGTTWKAVVERSVKELSEKRIESKSAGTVGTTEAKDLGLSILVEEALAIKQQLEKLGQRLGEEAKEAIAESAPPSS